MKTLKAIHRWYQGHELEPGEWRRIDAFLFELKCIGLTILVVFAIVYILWAFGTFVGKEQWQYKKY